MIEGCKTLHGKLSYVCKKVKLAINVEFQKQQFMDQGVRSFELCKNTSQQPAPHDQPLSNMTENYIEKLVALITAS